MRRSTLSVVGLGLSVLLVACGTSELDSELLDDEPPVLARERPQDWGYVESITSCEASMEDDVCQRCQKKSCCAQVEACNDNGPCLSLVYLHQECLYPLGGVWSGMGSQACKQRVLGMLPELSPLARLAFEGMIECTTASCSTEETCGVEPRAVFSSPRPAGSDFSAAQFLEGYCSGCHFNGFLGPTGHPTSALSRDPAWWGPFASSQWFDFMDYELAVEKTPAIRCGVAKAEDFSNDCLTLPSVVPGFFTGPAKFPPSGRGMYGGSPNPCRFAPDGFTCPQPTDFERARLLSWIADGAPR
jgi:hypothetical protein